MRKRKCLVVGLDGFDPDVLANLIVFYRACGFDVCIASTPRDCDLLVIQRGKYQGGIFEARAQACHIYDYAGTGASDLHLAFPNVRKCVVIAPGPHVSGRMASPQRVVRSFHPVIPGLWRVESNGERRRLYNFVHIGHRKAAPGGDGWLTLMDAVARDGECHFWGGGWHDVAGPNSQRVHGPVSLHGSQHIYRQTRFSLGVMYPFQRAITLSGRMWQAPLNGCVLFSEVMIPDRVLPGVEICQDYREVIRTPPAPPSSAALVEEASEYWNAVTVRLAPLLELEYRVPNARMLGRTYFEWIYLRHVKDSIERRFRG